MDFGKNRFFTFWRKTKSAKTPNVKLLIYFDIVWKQIGTNFSWRQKQKEWRLIFRFPVFGVTGVRRVRRIRGHLTLGISIGAMIKMEIILKWFQKGYSCNLKTNQDFFAENRRFLSETCGRGSIAALKIRSAGYQFWPFFWLESVSLPALRQRLQQERLRSFFLPVGLLG